MATFKSLFPSKADTWLTFSSILFLVNVWAIVTVLWTVPSMILSRTIWEMIGIISYSLAFALFESLLFLIGLIILAVILPKKFFRDKFVAMGSMAALLATLGMFFAHFYGENYGIWPVREFGKFLLILIGIILVSWVILYFFNRLASILESIAGFLTTLSAVYLAIDILAVIVVLIRNIT
ncbi:MAG: hypothetical protein ACK2UM_07865 [Anaerolineales bacterium]